jgi:hypothetical protein
MIGIGMIIFGAIGGSVGDGFTMAIFTWIIGYVLILLLYITIWAFTTVAEHFNIPCWTIVAIIIVIAVAWSVIDPKVITWQSE